jgi:hypothetical protein
MTIGLMVCHMIPLNHELVAWWRRLAGG